MAAIEPGRAAQVEGTAFGQTLLLSVYEKLSSGSPIEEILSLLDRIEATISCAWGVRRVAMGARA